MRVLVTGDREWKGNKDESVMYEGFTFVQALSQTPIQRSVTVTEPRLIEAGSGRRPITIVEGCARGADQMAERLATMIYHWPLEHHPANWGKYGNGAGAIRNQEMLDAPGGIDLCIAFHRDLKRSKGTLDMIERCLRAGIEVRLYPRS